MNMNVWFHDEKHDLSEINDRNLLLTMKAEIDADIDNIRDQLKRAEVTLKTTGKYADPDWYWKAVRARKLKARDSQKIQLRLGQIRKERKGRKTVSDFFVDIAKERLERGQFYDYLDEAEFRYKEQSSNPPEDYNEI